MPDCIDRLHRWQMTGVTCGDKRFSSQVGMGSRKQDLEGELRSNHNIHNSMLNMSLVKHSVTQVLNGEFSSEAFFHKLLIIYSQTIFHAI